MINLYRKDETNFRHNQFVLNECKSCDVTEEINAAYEVNLEYPFNDSKDITKELVNEAIIKIPSYDERENQLFVIRRAKPNLENNTVTCYAQAISFAKLDNNVVLDVNAVGVTRKQAMQQILSGTINNHKFVVGNKDTNITAKDISIVRLSVLSALKGEKDSILSTYGGELIPNNFTVDFVDQRGNDNGIVVSYAKNITGAELTLEDIDKITEIIPVGSNGLMLPEKSIKSDNFSIINPFTRVIEFNDIGVVEPEYEDKGNCTNSDKVVTQDQAYELLRQACRDKFNIEKVNETKFNLTLNFVELADYIDFEGNDYAEVINKRVAIGDTIKVNIKPLEIELKGRIYKLTRDAITGRLKSAEIGYKKSTIMNTINKNDKKIQETNKKIDDTKNELKEDINESNQKTSDLEVKMEKSDTDILFEVKNNKEATDTAIQLMDGKIEERVTTDTFQSYKEQTADTISQKVSKGSQFGSELIEHFNEIVATVRDGTDHSVILNSDGLAVKNGAFTIYDSSGNIIFRINTDGSVGIKDLDMMVSASSGRNYKFYNTLADMPEIYIGSGNELKIASDGRFTCKSDCFYINDGYTLEEYIKHVMGS